MLKTMTIIQSGQCIICYGTLFYMSDVGPGETSKGMNEFCIRLYVDKTKISG